MVITLTIISLFIIAAVFSKDVIEIREQAPFTYACLDCSGPSSQTQPQIVQFINAFYQQKLMPAGKLFFLYYDYPGEVDSADNVRWAVCIPINETASVSAPLKKCKFDYSKVAYCLCLGPYEKSGAAYFEMLKFIEENGYKPAGPTLQSHLDDPNKSEPEKLRTEMMIPITEK